MSKAQALPILNEPTSLLRRFFRFFLFMPYSGQFYGFQETLKRYIAMMTTFAA